jgi:EAL domain-containing protein (putative c-di-GMP-specific phosphodiesterase class I)
MYHAKKTGYGQFHIYSAKQQYQVHLTQRMYWKNILEDAIENDRFVLFFQPILDLRTDRISHYECLVRLISEQGSVVPPGEFIEHAEVLGLIGHIDRIVMAKAIAQHLEFNKKGMIVGLSINLSGRSLNDRTVSHEIKRLLTLPRVNPEKIIFEITETAAISNFPSARTLINEMKNLGCRFAIDDFGVGFSSFQYLKDLAVDYVKIDGSFIRKIDTSHEDRIFVKSMSEIAHALGKKTIAEFVENEAIVSVLREYDIDYAQGYHIGKPRPIEHLNE